MTQPQQNQRPLQGVEESLNNSSYIAAIHAADIAAKRDEEIADEIVSDKGIFGSIKKAFREFRKPRLRIVEQYVCDGCDSVIAAPTDGFVVHGNIYVADPSSTGGLIGNNFPTEEDAKASEVKKNVFCKKCFCKALGLIPGDVSSVLTDMRDNAMRKVMGKK